MERFSAKDVASLLNFSVTNLKNYANLLEQQGYEIRRNVKNHREYSPEDIKVLQAMIYLNKEKSMLLEDAASFVTSSDTDINDILAQQNVTIVPELPQVSDNTAIGVLQVLSNVLKEQKALREDLIKRDEALMKLEKERFEQMQTMNEKMAEQTMLLETMKAEMDKQKAEGSKGFWKKLFG